ncbi:MAG: hypothetical protein AB7V77_00315 [Candidatus Woesearchaeota archaeon]
MKNKNSCPVNVYTEWAPLQEIIIGNSVNFNHLKIDESFRFMYENRDGKFKDRNYPWMIDKRYIEERQEDLNNLQELLEKEGIVVRRPAIVDEINEIKTPYFSSFTTASDSPRDMFLCYGDEIIETPPTNTKRYFEGYLLRDIFMDYFRKGAKWTVAPRPFLSIDKQDRSYWKDNLFKPINDMVDIEFNLDISIDAANCLKFGKDLVINAATKNQELGAYWLKNHFGDKYNIHIVRISDSHLDGHLIPIAPGKLLVNESVMEGLYQNLPSALQKWDIIPILDESKKFNYPPDHLQMATDFGMSVNVISLDEKRILIRDNAELTIYALKRAGFEPIPFRLRHSELFGGGLHCTTVDVRRKEVLENYFD